MISSRIFFWFCICFILGIFLNSFFYFNLISFLEFLILGIFLICVLWKYKKIAALGFCVLFMILGIWRYELAEAQLNQPELKQFFNQETSFVGCVINESDIRTNNIKLEVRIEELGAQVLITTQRYPEIKYGNVLKINGILKEPPEFEDFNYKDYLQRQGIYFLMSYPGIEILEQNCGNSIKQPLVFFKNKLEQSLHKIVPLPGSGFFEALIFGNENNISESWKQKLNITGTRHIAAVSGMNITIMCTILLNLLLYLGFWRKHALWLSLVLIFIYILMIGAPACAVRAGIMGCLLIFAQNFGRIAHTETLLIFALSGMLFINPLLLKSDIGFQLSFLAIAGLIYLGPMFSRILKKIKVPEFLEIRMNLASTLSAQIFTLPILLYNFGQLSLVAPITNILILPAIMPLTVLGFLFSFIGIFSQTLGQILSWPAQMLLMLIIKIIDIFSKFSWAAKTINVSWIFLVISYLLLAIFIYYLKKKQKLFFLDY